MGEASGEDVVPSEGAWGSTARKKGGGGEEDAVSHFPLVLAGHGEKGAEWRSWFSEDRTRTEE